MSISTWKKEFCSLPVEKVKQDSLTIVERDLKKWRGLTESNLDKHRVKITWGGIKNISGSGADFSVDSSTCSLCFNYSNESTDPEVPCADCPLFIVRGEVSCDDSMEDETEGPYYGLSVSDDPEPMIYWLEEALKMIEKERK